MSHSGSSGPAPPDPQEGDHFPQHPGVIDKSDSDDVQPSGAPIQDRLLLGLAIVALSAGLLIAVTKGLGGMLGGEPAATGGVTGAEPSSQIRSPPTSSTLPSDRQPIGVINGQDHPFLIRQDGAMWLVGAHQSGTVPSGTNIELLTDFGCIPIQAWDLSGTTTLAPITLFIRTRDVVVTHIDISNLPQLERSETSCREEASATPNRD